MAVNLISIVTQLLTPDMIAKIASALGLDSNLVQKMIGGAVPSLLASVADVASTPTGARQVANAVTQQQSGSLESLLSNLTQGSGQSTLANVGSSMLSGLFGGSTLETMSQALGDFAGVNKGSSKSLLSMLGPLALGALGQYARGAGLDAGGLASLLASQKQQITAAIPSGLADRLRTAGLVDNAAARTVARSSEATYAGRSGAATQWPYWLAGLAVLGGLAWYALRPATESVAELPRPTASPAATTKTVGVAPADVTIGDLTKRFNSFADGLKTVLPGITDTATAKTALPKLQEATAQLNEVGGLATKLTPESRKTLAQLIAAATPTIDQMCNKVLDTPGVGPVAKPAIDELRSKLDALSKS
jgi:hypothetical protein